jgi:hypothetical protein
MIRAGDTASGLARRLSGHPDNRFQAWFQIVDQIGRAVPKSQYDSIRAGWRACIVTRPAGAPVPVASAVESTSPLQNTIESFRQGNTPVLILCALFSLAVVFLWAAVDEYLARRERTLAAMTQFANSFVREFERPLVQPPAGPRPIRSRMVAKPTRGRMEILLAPNGIRRYPNLTDHRENVLYDVRRVGHLLRDQPFAPAAPYARDEWVVIPFHLVQGQRQAGVT